MKFLKVPEIGGPQILDLEWDDDDEFLKIVEREIVCETIQFTHRIIDGRRYVILCDDEGYLNDRPITAIYDVCHPAYVGSLLICKDDDYDPSEIAGLDHEDTERIKGCIELYLVDGEPRYILRLDGGI